MTDILYRFAASGHQDVNAAFVSIESSAKKTTAAVEKLFESLKSVGRRGLGGAGGGDGIPVGIGGGGGGGRRGGGPTSLEALARQVEKDQIRAAQRTASERAKSVQYVARIRDKYFADEQKNEQRSAQRKILLDQQVAKARKQSILSEMRDNYKRIDASASAEKKHVDRMASIHKSSADRIRKIKEDSEDRIAESGKQFRNKRIDGRIRSIDSIPGRLKGLALGGAAAIGAVGLGVGAAAIKDGFSLQSMANRISINARKHGEEFIDPTKLRKEFEATSIATNGVVSAEDIAAGQQRFIGKTGNIKQAREFSTTFAKTAAATDTSYEAVASAGAELAQKFAITTAKDMQEALAAVTFGGKEGAFELTDAAAKYAKLASAGATFGLDKGVSGVRTLQGLSQIAIASTGDPDTATSSVEAMFRQVVTNAGKLRGLGVDVFTDDSHTKTRSIEKLLPEILGATGGDKMQLQKIFGDEGKRAINPLIDTFTSAYGGATGKNGKKATEQDRVDAGKAAVSAQLQASINAPGTFADIEQDADQAAKSPAAKMDAIWARLTATMADRMLPVLERMIEKVEVSQGALDLFVGTFEALLDIIQAAALGLGLIKDPRDDPAYKRKKFENQSKAAERELAAMPSQDKIDALAKSGKTAEAAAMAEKLASPQTQARIAQLQHDKNIGELGVADLDNTAAGLNKAMMLGAKAKGKDDFATLYQSMATQGEGGTTEWQAKTRAQIISTSPGANLEANGKDFLEGENADQRNARLGYIDAMNAQKAGAGGSTTNATPDIAAKGLSSSFAELMKAAKAATDALNTTAAVKQPSISAG